MVFDAFAELRMHDDSSLVEKNAMDVDDHWYS